MTSLKTYIEVASYRLSRLHTFRNMYVYAYTYLPTIIIKKKRDHELRESKEGYMEGFRGRKEIVLIIITK